MNELSYPHNSEAERAVLGACLISREAIETVTEILIPEDFYEPNYRELYELIIGLYSAGKPADLVTVLEEMNRRGVADRLGGMPLIAELTQATTSVLFVGYHAEIVRDYGLRRRMKKAGDIEQGGNRAIRTNKRSGSRNLKSHEEYGANLAFIAGGIIAVSDKGYR